MGAALPLPLPQPLTQPQPTPVPQPLPLVFQDGYEPPRGSNSRGRPQIGLLFHSTMLAMMTTLLLPYPFMEAVIASLASLF